jgi:hypothetical protein
LLPTTQGAPSNVELFESLKIAEKVPFENIYSELNFFVVRLRRKSLSAPFGLGGGWFGIARLEDNIP